MLKLVDVKNLLIGVVDPNRADNRRAFILLFIFAGFGTLASFFLTVDEFILLKNPDATLFCSVNAVINCASVMQTWQASIFGFPNSIIGLMTYPVLMTVGVLGFLNIKLPKNLWLAVYVGIISGLLFAHWLFYESLYNIHILCPWCLLTIVSTIMIFGATSHYMLRNNILTLSKSTNAKVQKFLDNSYDKMIIISWIVLLVGLIIVQYGGSLFA